MRIQYFPKIKTLKFDVVSYYSNPKTKDKIKLMIMIYIIDFISNFGLGESTTIWKYIEK